MRSGARSSIGVIAVSAIVSLVAFASTAAALSPPPGEGQPASPGSCVLALTTAAADGGLEPGTATFSVIQLPTIDESLTVQLFLNGTVVQSRVVNPPPGLPVNFAPINVVVGDSISVNYILRNVSTYSTVCATVAGQTVVRVRAAAAALAFTGSSNTGTTVLVAVSALVVGLVFVVGARRRHRVNA